MIGHQKPNSDVSNIVLSLLALFMSMTTSVTTQYKYIQRNVIRNQIPIELKALAITMRAKLYQN